MAIDPYRELGVARTASADEIRKAFRKLAKQHHPDTNPGNKDAEEKFKRVSAAFDILGDADKRRKFDAGEIDSDGRETMRGGFGGFGGAGGPFGGYGGRGGRQAGPDPFESADFSDILSEMLGRGGGARGGGAGPGGFGGFSQRGSDVRAKLEIELEEAIQGGRKRIAFSDGRTIDVSIPKNSQDGQTLRLKGQGSPGKAGAGDAFIELSVKPHPIFKRDGDTLVMDLPVTFYDAVLGGRIEAPTPEGPVTLTVPKGSNSGAKLRLKGRGLPDSHGQRGDLFARLIVSLPEEADKELTQFAETWKKQKAYKPKRRA